MDLKASLSRQRRLPHTREALHFHEIRIGAAYCVQFPFFFSHLRLGSHCQEKRAINRMRFSFVIPLWLFRFFFRSVNVPSNLLLYSRFMNLITSLYRIIHRSSCVIPQIFIRRNHDCLYSKERIHSLSLGPHPFVISNKYIAGLCIIGMSCII